MGNTKEINIKNRIYYFFNDIINIEKVNSDLLKIDKKTRKSIGIYYIGYITMKDSKHVNIHSVNSLCIIINEVDGSIEEKNGNKYLTFPSTDKHKKILEKYTELWNKIKSLTASSSVECNSIDKSGKYEKDYLKIRFSSGNNLPLNKILKLRN